MSDITREDLAIAICELRETLRLRNATIADLEAVGKDWAAITAAQVLDAAITRSELRAKDAKIAKMRELLLEGSMPNDNPQADADWRDRVRALLKEEP